MFSDHDIDCFFYLCMVGLLFDGPDSFRKPYCHKQRHIWKRDDGPFVSDASTVDLS